MFSKHFLLIELQFASLLLELKFASAATCNIFKIQLQIATLHKYTFYVVQVYLQKLMDRNDGSFVLKKICLHNKNFAYLFAVSLFCSTSSGFLSLLPSRVVGWCLKRTEVVLKKHSKQASKEENFTLIDYEFSQNSQKVKFITKREKNHFKKIFF